jgi:hypothetical protein
MLTRDANVLHDFISSRAIKIKNLLKNDIRSFRVVVRMKMLPIAVCKQRSKHAISKALQAWQVHGKRYCQETYQFSLPN